MLPVQIAGLGWYLPERIVTNAELESAYSLEPGWVARTTGVRERRRATHETAAGMAAAAARRALDAAGMVAAEVDLIIAASSAPQQAIPCTAAYVQRELAAPDGASACFDVNATCLSFLIALQTAAHLLTAGSYRAALLVSSEIAGRSLNPAEPGSAVLFGDAAAAAVLLRAPTGSPSSVVWEQFATYSSGADLTVVRGGGTLHHPNDPATTPELNMFHMHGTGVYRQAARLAGPFIERFLARAGWAPEDVDAVVPHQASGHAVALLSARHGFRPEQVVSNLAERGNCIAASIPLALGEAVAAGRITRGQRVLLLGTGAGLTLGAIGLIF
ncbi:MAG: 3-oxoacyl-[acyl-carrier-protein] synthase III C-terminal domain-containing protein [Chloroflexi bacterium OHK40]